MPVTPDYKNFDFSKDITTLVSDFCIDENLYLSRDDLDRDGKKNVIFTKDTGITDKVTVVFSEKSENCTVFLGKSLRGKITIYVNGIGSLIYIGDRCDLNDFEIRSFQDEDKVIIGQHVTATGATKLISGNGVGTAKPSVIIGDDCMFAYNITIRNSDAHPIFSIRDKSQVNMPTASVIIEPYVWVGQNCSILKDVTIGACSVVALGCIVTKSVPRFSVVSGIPAISRPCNDGLWSRGYEERHWKKAKAYYEKFVAQAAETDVDEQTTPVTSALSFDNMSSKTTRETN